MGKKNTNKAKNAVNAFNQKTKTDPDGSYTGKTKAGQKPVQDADDM